MVCIYYKFTLQFLGQCLAKTCKIFYNNKYLIYKKGKLIMLKHTHSKRFGVVTLIP